MPRQAIEATGQSRDELAVSFADSRDYYTHYNPRGGSTAVRGIAPYVLTLQLQAFIEMLLFRELGFREEIDAIFTTPTPRYREIKNAQEQVGDEDTSVPLERSGERDLNCRPTKRGRLTAR